MNRKAIQISTSPLNAGGVVLITVADDGSIWQSNRQNTSSLSDKWSEWTRLPDLPQGDFEEARKEG
jgi:hypothetical protein